MFGFPKRPKPPEPRKGMPSPRLGEEEFKRRFRSQFQDPGFEPIEAGILILGPEPALELDLAELGARHALARFRSGHATLSCPAIDSTRWRRPLAVAMR